eukprot:TRINITY_DN2424_c2_g1_i1.p1 TRINITY_DN2424_c2_g1~~TRINITY_DN2424_c2_g1_i1.p1  ORF type:complete len:182 (+),score=59.42 TRINITY_DN2424_c2_g1_i1:80-547(+)
MTAVMSNVSRPSQWGQVGMVVGQVKEKLIQRLVPGRETDIVDGIEETLSQEFLAKVQLSVSGKAPKEACDIITKQILAVIVTEVKNSKQKKTTAHVTAMPTCTPSHCTTCTVCLEDASTSSHTWTQLACGHQIHQNCLVQWAQRTPSCPLCRKEM